MQVGRFLKRISLISIFLIPLILFFFFDKSRDQTSAIYQIPQNDLETLESFFQTLFLKESFGYTIYGKKPMSVVTYNDPLYRCNLWDFDSYNLQLRQGSECWKKYCSRIQSNDFVFLFYKNQKWGEMILINKQNFIDTVDQHQADFQKAFGYPISGEELISRMIKSSSEWNEVLKNSDYLMGIVLGYGRHNSSVFCRRREIEKKSYECRFSLNKLKTNPAPGYATIDEEIQTINRRFHLYQDNSLESNFISLPFFRSDSDSHESQELLEQYKDERKQILKIVEGGDFFQKAINKIASY
jgi:hypothetical protein